jgi:hypothetical protein
MQEVGCVSGGVSVGVAGFCGPVVFLGAFLFCSVECLCQVLQGFGVV